jgi:uncharacterized protein with GYD domain
LGKKSQLFSALRLDYLAASAKIREPSPIFGRRRYAMPNYVVLYRFTEQGRKSVRETVKRAAEIRKQNEARGFKVLGHYWTQGRYDLVAVVDAPSEEAMVAGLFGIAETGNVASESMRAFTAEEMQKILAKG